LRQLLIGIENENEELESDPEYFTQTTNSQVKRKSGKNF
jgi:hypothetical protein